MRVLTLMTLALTIGGLRTDCASCGEKEVSVPTFPKGDAGTKLAGTPAELGIEDALDAQKNPVDYREPAWYKQPKGTQAYEWTGPIAAATRSHDAGKGAMRPAGKPQSQEVVVRKPVSHGQH